MGKPVRTLYLSHPTPVECGTPDSDLVLGNVRRPKDVVTSFSSDRKGETKTLVDGTGTGRLETTLNLCPSSPKQDSRLLVVI